jgi:hypothetical protein
VTPFAHIAEIREGARTDALSVPTLNRQAARLVDDLDDEEAAIDTFPMEWLGLMAGTGWLARHNARVLRERRGMALKDMRALKMDAPWNTRTKEMQDA